MALTARISTQITGDYTSPLDLETPTASLAYSVQTDYASGTGAGQADMRWTDQRTLTASATENLDLAGSLVNSFGATMTFARVKYIYFRAAAGNTNDVQVTRPASNGWPMFLAAGDGVPIKPGGWFSWGDPGATGVAVTAGTGDLITVTNSAGGTPVTYDVIIIGASA